MTIPEIPDHVRCSAGEAQEAVIDAYIDGFNTGVATGTGRKAVIHEAYERAVEQFRTSDVDSSEESAAAVVRAWLRNNYPEDYRG